MLKPLTINCSKLFQLSLSSNRLDFIRFYYGGTWKNCRRLQNPEIVKAMPVQENVKSNNPFQKTRMVYVCGLGVTGSLGLKKFYRPEKTKVEDYKSKDIGTSTFRRLVPFTSSDKISDVSCGYGFTLIASQVSDSSHSVLGFGLNTHSQLGYHSVRIGMPLEIVSTPSPIYLPTKTPITRVSCGRSHSIFLNQSGEVFSLGNNSLGQCGRPIDENEIYFGSKKVHKIELPDKISSIECGQDHSMFLTETGELYSCGWGADGQTGLGHYNNQIEPAKVRGDLDGVRIVKVSSYADTALALDEAGNVFGWGNTEYSQFRTLANCESEQFNLPRKLKLKDIPGKIVDIAAGGTVCAILNDRGNVYVWGFGILGCGPNVSQSSKPLLVPETLFGRNVYNPDTKVVKIYASLSNFAAISDRGDLYAWGKNRGMLLGFSHGQDQTFPLRVNMNMSQVHKISLGVDHSCAIVEKVC